MPLVSVIIPTHNRAGWLPGAVDSVLAQSLAGVEIIVVDDGSDDDTVSALGPRMERVRYLRQERRGVAAARNLGIAAARGEMIAFLDSDDRFVPDKLARQLAFMRANPGLLISHTDEVWYRRGRLLNQKKKHARPHGYIFPRSLAICCVGMSTVMARPRFFELCGVFDEDFPCCEDYELWLRASHRLPFGRLAAALVVKNGGREDQLSVIHRAGMDRYRVRALLRLVSRCRLFPEQERAARLEICRRARIYGNGCIRHGRPEEGAIYLELAARAAAGAALPADISCRDEVRG